MWIVCKWTEFCRFSPLCKVFHNFFCSRRLLCFIQLCLVVLDITVEKDVYKVASSRVSWFVELFFAKDSWNVPKIMQFSWDHIQFLKMHEKWNPFNGRFRPKTATNIQLNCLCDENPKKHFEIELLCCETEYISFSNVVCCLYFVHIFYCAG